MKIGVFRFMWEVSQTCNSYFTNFIIIVNFCKTSFAQMRNYFHRPFHDKVSNGGGLPVSSANVAHDSSNSFKPSAGGLSKGTSNFLFCTQDLLQNDFWWFVRTEEQKNHLQVLFGRRNSVQESFLRLKSEILWFGEGTLGISVQFGLKEWWKFWQIWNHICVEFCF